MCFRMGAMTLIQSFSIQVVVAILSSYFSMSRTKILFSSLKKGMIHECNLNQGSE